ncbi:M1 family aminopeptidase [Solitalea koreensis]|uniref:Aminopeptidase N n=1 Tax=Solitalea koreensis TaxID=543615 RepID=A0A521CIR0_9SPHI|nr:M1 family aminopeptidase [Solitalea koreensis]SMO58590.1 aminopeptidase N [Solitalea koreensis]
MKKSILLFSGLCYFLLSCSTAKHVELPEMVVKANSNETLAKANIDEARKPYMAAYTKINDIINTKLDLSFNWDSAFVNGSATIKLKPYFYPTDTLKLSAKGFQIKQVALVTASGKIPLRYSYNGKCLSINLDKAYARNEEYTVFVEYVAMPNKIVTKGSEAITADKGLYFINNDGKIKDKPKEIWSQGETESNSCWFPTIDGPQEKMTQEISLTVDKKYNTLSNGLMVASKDNGNGTRTDTWKQDKPHSTYLTMIAVGDFAVVKDRWRNIEVNYYVEPQYEKYARMIFGNTPEMIEFYSNRLGVDYPWDKYSQIVVRDFVSGAMENTTATVHFDKLQMDDRQYLDETHEDIICHELFHHWFGDLVTCESWPNLPLNESFATYGEYLWLEHKYGREEADIHGQLDLIAYLNSRKDFSKKLIRFDVADREDMFDLVTYQKGGRVLHMLRKYVGDDAFFAALKLYLERRKFNNAEINDLRLAFEEVTGEDLNWFFNQWFMSSGQPDLSFASTYDAATKKVQINVAQLQDFKTIPLYRLPLDVDFYVSGKVERKRILIDKASQQFTFDFDSKPNLVNIDAEKMLLATKREVKANEEWIFQYNNGPLVIDRLDALQNLSINLSDTNVQQVFKVALNDKAWAIRMVAIQTLGSLPASAKDTFYPLLVDKAKNDKKSIVRATAVSGIAAMYPGKNNKALFQQTLTDKSPMVEDASKTALTKGK